MVQVIKFRVCRVAARECNRGCHKSIESQQVGSKGMLPYLIYDSKHSCYKTMNFYETKRDFFLANFQFKAGNSF